MRVHCALATTVCRCASRGITNGWQSGGGVENEAAQQQKAENNIHSMLPTNRVLRWAHGRWLVFRL